ncbi:unnamed protein product [Schistosoma mattheei]|uniref:Uncharacterized protein n=1 Tax=Schistosoma mattheei TaxID=31246 RepID=A0A183NHV6_9TREM|nr:unnamed protein product [Schistosoma mattheei]
MMQLVFISNHYYYRRIFLEFPLVVVMKILQYYVMLRNPLPHVFIVHIQHQYQRIH